jgi:hypothetical protein
MQGRGFPAIHIVCGKPDDAADPALPGLILHHADASAVRTYPGGAITHPPLVLIEADVADLKTADAVPAERQDLLATMTLEFLAAPPPPGI